MSLAPPITFLREFLHKPAELGSFLPSSRFLESRIVRLGAVQEDSVVVELGPGIGGTTRAILRELPPTSRFIAVELNSDFIPALEAIGDGRLSVHHGSAEDLPQILAQHGLESVDVIFSGIPFSTIPPADRTFHSQVRLGCIESRRPVRRLSTAIAGQAPRTRLHGQARRGVRIPQHPTTVGLSLEEEEVSGAGARYRR